MVPALFAILLPILIMGKKGAPGKAVKHKCSKTSILASCLSKIILFPAAIYSVFLPLELGTAWFYIGLPISLIGLIGTILVLVDWAFTPAGEPVTRGIYRYSRNPQYVTMVLLLFGVSIISISWVFFLLTIITMIGVGRPYFVKLEEAFTLGHYGKAYSEYMNRTPRWIGLPKSKKKE